MATDPTRSNRHFEHPLTYHIPAPELLDRLSGLPAQYDVPYLTITLDWQIKGGMPGRRPAEDVKRSQTAQDDGGSDRPSLRELKQTLNQMIDEHGPRGDIFEALEKSRDRIDEWIQNDLVTSAQGVYIVTHEPSGVFEATGLNLPVDTSIVLDEMPHIYKIVRMLEDHPTYAVLQADQTTATLSFITRGARDQSVNLESNMYPRKQQTGGLNQAQYQRRADERIEAFSRDTLNEVEKAMQHADVDVLIMAGNEVMMSALHNEMSDGLKDMVADTIRMEPTASSHEKIDLTIGIAEEAERGRERESVDRLKSAIGQDNMGVTGKAETLRALQNGQVDMLVMCDTFEGSGWADYDMNMFGVGDVPAEHPAGGDVSHIADVSLPEEMVRLALNTGADVDIIHSEVPVVEGDVPAAGSGIPKTGPAEELVEMGGVGAILRYTMN